MCTAAVCVTDEESDTTLNGDAFIQQLTESSPFVVPFDTQQQWFRYHHLFQDRLLRQLRKRKDKGFISPLQSKASNWFAETGFISDAIRYALAPGDTEAAVLLVGQHRHDLMNSDQWRRLDRWLKQFPPQLHPKNTGLLLSKA